MTFRIDQGTLGSVVVGKIMDVATSVEVVGSWIVNWGGGLRMLPSV
jgi:hypothetical protein